MRRVDAPRRWGRASGATSYLAWRITIGIAFVLRQTTIAHAQAPVRGVIDGTVTDTNLVPLPNVEASVAGAMLRVLTGANGRFQIVGLPAGQYVLTLRRNGFVPASSSVDVAGGDTLRLSFMLQSGNATADTLASSSLIADAHRAQFDANRGKAMGYFMTEDEITQRKANSTRELLRGMPNVRIQGSFASYSRVTTFKDACPFMLVVDGKALPSTNLDGLPEPRQLVGLEVHPTTASVPLDYQSLVGDRCGAVLAWTKSP